MIDWLPYDFADPQWFWLLVLVPLFVVLYMSKSLKIRANIFYGSPAILSHSKSWKHYLKNALFGLNMAAYIMIIIALARPQSNLSWQNISNDGIDIMLAMDISGSMLAMDFKPDRLEAGKKIAESFIQARTTDRIGLVVYAGKSFTQCPLTTDHAVLKNLMSEIKHGMIPDGTAIGNGLATAVDRLRDSEAKSKVIVLLTDGTNNKGNIPPLTAAEIAKTFGVRVYTIGLGTNGKAPFPFQLADGRVYVENIEVKIDEKTLRDIAELTGGNYYRATKNEDLEAIYAEIDQLEKSKIQVTEYQDKNEEFEPFILIAVVLLTATYILDKTLLKSIV